jgi:hypothetical protein
MPQPHGILRALKEKKEEQPMTRTLRLHRSRAAAPLAACAAILCLVLAGCGGGAPLFTSDGRATTLVQCPREGPASACMENARGMCGGDFDVVKQYDDNGMHNLVFACRAR